MTSLHFNIGKGLCGKFTDNTEPKLLLQLLEIDPGVVQEKDGYGMTLLHYAASNRSPEFCQLLIDSNPELLRTADDYDKLPFHIACYHANVHTAKYFYHRFPGEHQYTGQWLSLPSTLAFV